MTYYFDIKTTGETRSLIADTDDAAIAKVKELEGDDYLVGISMIYARDCGEIRTIWLE